MSAVEEALAALGEAEPFGSERVVFHATVAAVRDIWDTRKPEPPPKELVAVLPNGGVGLIGEYVRQFGEWRDGREKIEPGAEGSQLFGYPLVIHDQGPRRFWVEERP